MALTELLQREMGVKTYFRSNYVVSQIPATLGEIMRNSPNRLSYVIVNLGLNDAYIGWDKDVSAIKGVVVPASGGSVSLNWKDDFDLVSWTVYGIAPGGAVNCYILEVLEV